MTKKILFGGLIGGIVLFIWGALSWMVSPLHKTTTKPLPGGDALRIAFRLAVKELGVYFFPGYEHRDNMTKEERAQAEKDWQTRYHEGPHGLLIYQPHGAEPMDAKT